MVLKEDQNIIATFADIISEPKIVSEIEQLRTFLQQGKPVGNMRALKDRISADIETIHKKLHILGYYGSKIDYNIRVTGAKNAVVNLDIDL
jgi:hypothetical protein